MNDDRLLKTFLDLVQIDSPSKQEADVANYCAHVLEDCGCKVKFDTGGIEAGSNTGNLYAYLPGTMDGCIVMTAHMDCVVPCENVKPAIKDGIIYSDGSTVLGGDDKVGIASILEAVRCCAESDTPHRSIKVIFTVQEEIGCFGSKAFNAPDFFDGEPCYVFDMDGKPGCIVCGAPYHYTFEAKFIGKASHAGVAPEKGINAIAAAACAINAINEQGILGRVKENCASNIGTIKGGSRDNIIPDCCKLTGECRAVNKDDVEEVKAAMTAALNDAANKHGAKVEIDWQLEYPGFMLSEDDETVQLFYKAAREAGLQPSCEVSAGGSDANVFAAKNTSPCVVGTGMTNFHSLDEQLSIEDLNNTAKLAYALACCKE